MKFIHHPIKTFDNFSQVFRRFQRCRFFAATIAATTYASPLFALSNISIYVRVHHNF
jgi:hypothetical protein